jgi:hypothetical protein
MWARMKLEMGLELKGKEVKGEFVGLGVGGRQVGVGHNGD